METHNEPSVFQDRTETNHSLEVERANVDHFILNKNSILDQKTDQAIDQTRKKSDSAIETQREKTDQKIEAKNPAKIETELNRERQAVDTALDAERKKTDQIRRHARKLKQLTGEVLFERERSETDSDLENERSHSDQKNGQWQELLSDEQRSHIETKMTLTTRDQLLAVVSHDLRDPLTSIVLNADVIRSLLEKGIPDPKVLLAPIESIERNTSRMERLIDSLLDVESMTHGNLRLHKETFDLAETIQECTDLFAPVAKKYSINISYKMGEHPLFCEFDRDRITQTISNLVSNAIKFSPNGGSVELATRKIGDEVLVTVSDTGPGIPEEKKELVFERFSQLLTKNRRGIGLGLFISKWLVEAHGGHIWVTSKLGKGSIFAFTLPTQAHSVSH
jgi:signal transduction histidine kinase